MGPEEFTFSEVDREESEEDEDDGKREAIKVQKAPEDQVSPSWSLCLILGHMLIDAQSKLKPGKVQASLEATKTDLQSGDVPRVWL